METNIPCLIIRYAHHLGGHIKDRRYWESCIEGDSNVYDYNSKKALIQEAESKGWHWKVLKLTRGKGWTVVQESNKVV